MLTRIITGAVFLLLLVLLVLTCGNWFFVGAMTLACIVAVYDFYETLAEKLMNNITAMLVRLNCNEGFIKMNVQMGCLEDIAKQVLDGVHMPLGSLVYDIDDEDISITLTLTNGGAVE